MWLEHLPFPTKTVRCVPLQRSTGLQGCKAWQQVCTAPCKPKHKLHLKRWAQQLASADTAGYTLVGRGTHVGGRTRTRWPPPEQ